MNRSPIQHGGNQYAIRKRLNLGDQPLLDVSVSLNPFGPPRSAIEAARAAMERAHQYPEPGNPRLVETLAERHGVGVENVFVGAGTSEIISLTAQSQWEPLMLLVKQVGDPKLALSHMVDPIYAEYRRASLLNDLIPKVWKRPSLGWTVDFVPKPASGIYWTGNPVSPLGHAWKRERLLKAADESPELLVVVDEAYTSFYPDEAERTVVAEAPKRKNLLVLRSVTKIYGFPGLRVGYAVGSAEMVNLLREFQNPWSVDSASEAALMAALQEAEYLARTVELVQEESKRLTDEIWEMPGLRPVWPSRERPESAPARPNWVLVSLVDTPWNSVTLHEALARKGILARECSNFSGLEPGSVLTGADQEIPTNGHLRFAVRTADQNDRVLAVLGELMKSGPPKG